MRGVRPPLVDPDQKALSDVLFLYAHRGPAKRLHNRILYKIGQRYAFRRKRAAGDAHGCDDNYSFGRIGPPANLAVAGPASLSHPT